MVATPSPIITPVSTVRSRDHAHSAAATQATASRSQFTRPDSSRAGETANSAASQGRPRWTPASSHAASSASAPKPTAFTATKRSISVRTAGSPASVSAGVPARASRSGEPLSRWVISADHHAQ